MVLQLCKYNVQIVTLLVWFKITMSLAILLPDQHPQIYQFFQYQVSSVLYCAKFIQLTRMNSQPKENEDQSYASQSTSQTPNASFRQYCDQTSFQFINFQDFVWKKNALFPEFYEADNYCALSENQPSFQKEFMTQHTDVLETAIECYMKQHPEISKTQVSHLSGSEMKTFQEFESCLFQSNFEFVESERQKLQRIWNKCCLRKVIRNVAKVSNETLQGDLLYISTNLMIKYEGNDEMKNLSELALLEISKKETFEFVNNKIHQKNIKMIRENKNEQVLLVSEQLIQRVVITIIYAVTGFFENPYYEKARGREQHSWDDFSTELNNQGDYEEQSYRSNPSKKFKFDF